MTYLISNSAEICLKLAILRRRRLVLAKRMRGRQQLLVLSRRRMRNLLLVLSKRRRRSLLLVSASVGIQARAVCGRA